MFGKSINTNAVSLKHSVRRWSYFPRVPHFPIATPSQNKAQQFSTSITSAPARSPVKPVPRNEPWSDDQYRLVPFVKENLRSVVTEVPDFKYYFIGDDDPKRYPYQDIPMDQPISVEEDRPEKVIAPSRELQLSRLENGLRIVSLDRGGYLANLGLFIHAGSRFETEESFGCSHFIEHMAYYATAHLSWLRTIKTIETLGIQAGCMAGREHMLYHAELERRYVPIMIPLLTGNVVFPRFLSWEVDKRQKEYEQDLRDKFEKNIDAQITEYLHRTAWRNNTLGNRLVANSRTMKNYSGTTMRSFMLKHFSPNRMVMVGINIDHEILAKWTMRAFVDYEAIPPSERDESKAQYTGGESRIDAEVPVSHLVVAFETVGGWNGEDLVPLTVLQTILGGGGSFSTGGPGKGMHTRLYLEVLSTNWVESCSAFSTQYSDSGLFGLYVTCQHAYGSNLMKLLAHQFKRMDQVTAEELKRAKNALKSSILMNLESRAVVLEDLGRQLLMSGRIMSGQELCAKVDAVTAQDIARAARRMLATPATVVAYGDVNALPLYQDIVSAIKN